MQFLSTWKGQTDLLSAVIAWLELDLGRVLALCVTQTAASSLKAPAFPSPSHVKNPDAVFEAGAIAKSYEMESAAGAQADHLRPPVGSFLCSSFWTG